MCSGQKQGGLLVEAHLSIEKRALPRGNLVYQYGVKQRGKESVEVATRQVWIQFDSSIKGNANKPPQQVCSFVSLSVDHVSACFIQSCTFMKASSVVRRRGSVSWKLAFSFLAGVDLEVKRCQTLGRPQRHTCWTESSRNGLRLTDRALRACVTTCCILLWASVLYMRGWCSQTIGRLLCWWLVQPEE